jgi:hypothetical protein
MNALCLPTNPAATSPSASNAVPKIAAPRNDTRPEGIGRPDRSRASMFRSNRSLNTIPARYSPDDATSSSPNSRPDARSGRVSRNPRRISAIAVNTAANRQS